MCVGEKTEFRTRPREGSNLIVCKLPTPVVAYTKRGASVDAGSARMMVLIERRLERLFDISENPEALVREGFDSHDEFRGYWKRRNGGVYKPSQRVYVWRVRPFDAHADEDTLGRGLFRELYGEHLVLA